jgi:hypothetical protein
LLKEAKIHYRGPYVLLRNLQVNNSIRGRATRLLKDTKKQPGRLFRSFLQPSVGFNHILVLLRALSVVLLNFQLKQRFPTTGHPVLNKVQEGLRKNVRSKGTYKLCNFWP